MTADRMPANFSRRTSKSCSQERRPKHLHSSSKHQRKNVFLPDRSTQNSDPFLNLSGNPLSVRHKHQALFLKPGDFQLCCLFRLETCRSYHNNTCLSLCTILINSIDIIRMTQIRQIGRYNKQTSARGNARAGAEDIGEYNK